VRARLDALVLLGLPLALLRTLHAAPRRRRSRCGHQAARLEVGPGRRPALAEHEEFGQAPAADPRAHPVPAGQIGEPIYHRAPALLPLADDAAGAEERSTILRRAVRARWAKAKRKKTAKD
jgi:hypothetical protein